MAAKFVAPLIAAEQAAGYVTELVTSRGHLQTNGMVTPYDLSGVNLLGLPRAFWKIFRYLRARRPDVVISHNTKSSLLPLLVARFVGIRIRVYFNHGVPYVGYRGGLRWLLFWLERLNCSFATHVVTVSADMKELLQVLNPSIKTQVIQEGSACGIELQAFTPGRYSRTDWRKFHGLVADDLVVTYIGRPVARKGFELVLRLWSDHFLEPHFKLVLCGPEPVDVLKRFRALPSNILCLGFVSDMAEVLACSDVLIMPSLHEGLSYACMEAQASGVVVVANDIAGIRCLIEDGVNGYLVPGNSLKKYIEIIRHIDTDRSVLEGIRRQARASVERYSRELFIPAYLYFLKGLSSKQAAGDTVIHSMS